MSFNLNLKLKLANNDNEALLFKASLINNIWYGIKGTKKYKINVAKDSCNKLRYIFSSATNDYWPIGTPREHVKLNVVKYEDFGLWTPFREGLPVKGTVINDLLIVDWKHNQKIIKVEYERATSKAVKELTNGSSRINLISHVKENDSE